MRKQLLLLFASLSINSVSAQLLTQTGKPFYLTFSELNSWTSTGTTANSANVSSVPLKVRDKSLPAQLNPNLSFNMKIDWATDSMDRWNNYLGEITKFNTYNFTNWAYIDKFTWFSNASNGVFIPPRAVIEAAHKNGVKILGTIFIDNNTNYSTFITNSSGNYTAAGKLLAIAKYYGFDGYIFNMEASTTSTNATHIKNLMKQIQTLNVPANTQYYNPNLDISWYDALWPTGTLSYQNQLNANNSAFFNDTTVVSNSFFTNYAWTSTGVNTSVTTASNLSRSPFDVYMGVDGFDRSGYTTNVANGYIRNKNFMDSFFTTAYSVPKISVALYALANLAYQDMTATGSNQFIYDPAQWSNYYDSENRFFSGTDLNATTADASGNFKGIGYYVPARTVITSLPFKTSFNIGQGRVWSVNGTQTTRDWSDMSKQDILPTWQWAVTGGGSVVPRMDPTMAYNGGSSIKLSGSLNNNNNIIKLYLTKLMLTNKSKFDLTYKAGTSGETNLKLLLYFSDNLTTPIELDLGSAADTNWNTRNFDLSSYSGKELNIIAVKAVSVSSVPSYQLYLGEFNVYEDSGTLATIEKGQNKLELYPNPAKEIVTVKLSNNLETKVSIYSSTGQLVLEKIIKGRLDIDTSKLSKGIYIVHTENTEVKTFKKLIIE